MAHGWHYTILSALSRAILPYFSGMCILLLFHCFVVFVLFFAVFFALVGAL